MSRTSVRSCFRPAARDCCRSAVRLGQLEKKLARQRTVLETRRLKWRREKAALLAKIRRLDLKAAAVTKLIQLGTFSSQQVRRLATGKRVLWTAKEVGVAVGLRCLSRKAYQYVQQVLRFPMPSATTLAVRTRGFRLTEGVIEGAQIVLEAAVKSMSEMERLCVISFDEVSIDGRWCYDQMSDRVLSASKLQLLMVRGLTASWKQPYYYDLDSPMNIATLNDVIIHLEATGLRVMAAVSDMAPENETMWRNAGVSDEKTWITNPFCAVLSSMPFCARTTVKLIEASFPSVRGLSYLLFGVVLTLGYICVSNCAVT